MGTLGTGLNLKSKKLKKAALPCAGPRGSVFWHCATPSDMNEMRKPRFENNWVQGFGFRVHRIYRVYRVYRVYRAYRDYRVYRV